MKIRIGSCSSASSKKVVRLVAFLHYEKGRGAYETVADRWCGFVRLILCLCGLVGVVGCRTVRSVAAPDVRPPVMGVAQARSTDAGDDAARDVVAMHKQVRRLTGTQFEKAALFMPAAEDVAKAPPLAPLIVVNMSWALTVTLDSVQRCVHTLRVAGQPHEMLDYRWFLGGKQDFDSAPLVEGYRLSLLLGADGFPIVARVVRFRPDVEDRPLYFVSRSLEEAAIDRFGPPLPGRAFAVEAPLAGAPDFFVAGVFDDGPVPMGPYVYVDPNGVGVVTVLCRCAPSQVDDFAMTAYYDPVDAPGTAPPDGEVDDPFSTLTDVLRWPFRASDGGRATPEPPR